MNPYFKIVYRTTDNELFSLTIPNAFDFKADVQENVTRINTAARNILTANAIETSVGNLSAIESITFYKNDTTTFDVSGY